MIAEIILRAVIKIMFLTAKFPISSPLCYAAPTVLVCLIKFVMAPWSLSVRANATLVMLVRTLYT